MFKSTRLRTKMTKGFVSELNTRSVSGRARVARTDFRTHCRDRSGEEPLLISKLAPGAAP